MKTLLFSAMSGVLLLSVACGGGDKSKGGGGGGGLIAAEKGNPKPPSPEEERSVVLEASKVLKDLTLWWGDASKRTPPNLLNEHPLSPFTQKILLETGLPQSTRVSMHFYPGEMIKKHTFHRKEFLVIGSIHDRTQIGICLDNEEIYALDMGNGHVPVFVNSDLVKLLQFIRSYTLDIYISAKPHEAADYIKLKAKYIAMDSKALDGEDTWWNLFINQHLSRLVEK